MGTVRMPLVVFGLVSQITPSRCSAAIQSGIVAPAGIGLACWHTLMTGIP